MKTILFIVLTYWSVVGADKCVPVRNWNIKQAFYYNKQLILITPNEEVYAVKGFKYWGPKIEFESIDKITLFDPKFLRELVFIFSYQNHVFIVKRGDLGDVPILVAKNLTFDENMTTVLEQSADIDINPYSAVPKKDPLNLMSLFVKFPEEKLAERMKAIISFPSNEKSLPNFDGNIPELPNRFFVYYSEYPTQKAKEKNLTKIVNKRHILIKTISDFRDYTEVNWKRDSKSGSCFEEKNDISAATRLSDRYTLYSKVGETAYDFEIMEFFGFEYSIKRVEVNKEDVLKDLIPVKSGSLIDLFSCIVEKIPDPIDPEKDPDIKDPDIKDPDIKDPDIEEPTATEDLIRLILYILISVFVIGIFILIFVIIYIVWKKKQKRRKHHHRSGHHRSESNTKSQASDLDKDSPKKPVYPVVQPKNSSKSIDFL